MPENKTQAPTNVVQAQTRKPKTVRDHLDSEDFKQAVAKALPKHITPDRFIRIALTTITRIPRLADCDQHSLFDKLLTLSQLGIEPDGRRAHLIPFKNNKRNIYEVQLIIDYKGLVELAMRSGVVSYLHADVICENDDFDYDRGVIARHKIDFKQPRGAVYAAYALAKFKDGGEKCEVMTIEEVESIRMRSRAKDEGPWVTDYKEMCKKTVFRRLSKWLPLSPEFRDAIEKDFDTIEEEVRFRNAKPVNAVGFELPPPEGEVGETEGEPVRLGRPPKTASGTALDPEAGSTTTPATPPPQPAAPSAPAPAAETENWPDRLAMMCIKNGYNFDDFASVAREAGWEGNWDNITSFEEVPVDLAKNCVTAKRSVLLQLERHKKGAA